MPCCFLKNRRCRSRPPPGGVPAVKLKVVLAGDGYCGKTSLQVAFRKDEFDEADLDESSEQPSTSSQFDPTYRPTIFEAYETEIQLEEFDVPFQLSIWDTPGQEDYERLRPLSYPHADIIVLCFAVDSPDSLDNIEDKWIKELEYFCPKVPVILVANKTDLRDDEKTLEELKSCDSGPLKPVDGAAMAERIGAVQYLECSAKKKRGIREVFEAASKAAVKHRKRKRNFIWHPIFNLFKKGN